MSTIQDEKQAVAREILRQLQVLKVSRMGFSFLPLTGAEHFSYTEDSLTFKIKHKNKRKINTIKITLNWKDLYDVEFWNSQLLKKAPYVVNEKIDTAEDVYADMLPDLLAGKVELA